MREPRWILRIRPWSLRGLLIAVLATVPGGSARPDDGASVEIGRSLYLHGRLPTGEPLQGIVQGDIPVSGAQIACVGCHRRSGLGSSEGGNLAPPVTSRALYAERLPLRHELAAAHADNPARRPAYSDATLRRALRDGINAAGRPLDPLMPRYRLDDAQIDALIAYLRTLDSLPAPGVDATTLHLATIVTPDVAPQRREAMLQVLRTFFEDKDANTRNELRRAARAPWHIDWKLQAYRDIRLHTWELSGAPAAWPGQLQDLYAAQPVFAVVSGVGAGSWAPVHAFCEDHGVPCLFPNTALPVDRAEDFYSVYFSAGMALEGRVAARYVSDRGARGPGTVLQLVADTPEAVAAAAAFRAAYPQARHADAASGTAAGFDWPALRARHNPHTVVLWAPEAQAESLLAAIASASGEPPLVLLSHTLAPLHAVPPNLRGRVYAIRPTALAQPPARGLERTRAWLRSRQLRPDDVDTALNTYFAATITAGAIKMLQGHYSREYLIERIEHGTENALSSGAYLHLALGQNQRFASKGAYVVPLADASEAVDARAMWVVP